MSSSHNIPHIPNTPQPKIDATDRRQIEAQHEDKSHTTMEALDDIKHIHQKEKAKKENNNVQQYQTAIESQGRVSKT